MNEVSAWPFLIWIQIGITDWLLGLILYELWQIKDNTARTKGE